MANYLLTVVIMFVIIVNDIFMSTMVYLLTFLHKKHVVMFLLTALRSFSNHDGLLAQSVSASGS